MGCPLASPRQSEYATHRHHLLHLQVQRFKTPTKNHPVSYWLTVLKRKSGPEHLQEQRYSRTCFGKCYTFCLNMVDKVFQITTVCICFAIVAWHKGTERPDDAKNLCCQEIPKVTYLPVSSLTAAFICTNSACSTCSFAISNMWQDI